VTDIIKQRVHLRTNRLTACVRIALGLRPHRGIASQALPQLFWWRYA
jgi:hypothetical protein